MANVSISTYGNSNTLDHTKCMDKYAVILVSIEEEAEKIHRNSGDCSQWNEYINQKIEELNECKKSGFLNQDLHVDDEIKRFKEKCNKYPEGTSKSALPQQQATKLKLEKEGTPEQSEACGLRIKAANVEGGASQKESDETRPTTSILEVQRTGENGIEYAEVYYPRKGQVLNQNQHVTYLYGSAVGTSEEKAIALFIQEPGACEGQEPLSGSGYQGTTELGDCKNNPLSQCNLEEKSIEAGIAQPKVLEEISLQSDSQDDNDRSFSKNSFENPNSEGDATPHHALQLVSTELGIDTTDSDNTDSSKYDSSEVSDIVNHNSDDHYNQGASASDVNQTLQEKTQNPYENTYNDLTSQSIVHPGKVDSDQGRGEVTLPKDRAIVVTESNQPNEGNEGVPYKKYILMVLGPLAIILLLAFLIKVIF